LVVTKFFKALFGVAFVIALAGLSSLLIYQILNSSRCLYNWRIAIMLIIRRFSLVVLSLTKHLYNKKESVQTTVSIASNLSCSVIILSVKLIAKLMFVLAIIL
jgi:hypothetical protein